MSPPSSRTRLSIDVSADERRRLRMAAARCDQSIRDYVWEAISARLDGDAAQASAASAPIQPGGQVTDRTDPVLAALWNNPEDAIYDDL